MLTALPRRDVDGGLSEADLGTATIDDFRLLLPVLPLLAVRATSV